MLCFGIVKKTVPICMKWTINVHLFDMNGLVCVEIDRLRHYFNVLVQ